MALADHLVGREVEPRVADALLRTHKRGVNSGGGGAGRKCGGQEGRCRLRGAARACVTRRATAPDWLSATKYASAGAG